MSNYLMKSEQGLHEKAKLPVSLMNIESKLLNKIVTDHTQQYNFLKKINPFYIRFIPGMQGCFHIEKSI